MEAVSKMAFIHHRNGSGTISKSTLHNDPGHPSADPELFTPILDVNCAEDKNTDEYRFLCPHAGHFKCKLTNIVFEMKSKGEVLYRIVSWDSHLLNGSPQKEPAGPLYNFDSPEGCISRLHFPHCEIGKSKAKLTVAHVAGGKVDIIQPLTVTETHVIINIQHLSPFGLTLPWTGSPIRAQVLLFYKRMTEHSRSKLHIHLLPANVPVKEVQEQHESYTYIDTTSSCDLKLGKKYKLLCNSTETDYTLQPEAVIFRRDCGPNYHPTFEVQLNIEAAEVTLTLLDRKGKEVWTSPPVLLTDAGAASLQLEGADFVLTSTSGAEFERKTLLKTESCLVTSGTEAASANMDTAGADFVDKHKAELIQRFISVMEVVDRLNSKNMITAEMYSTIKAKPTPQEKMRELYTCLDSGGRASKEEFYDILVKNHSGLVDDLKSESDQS
ncbi:hypothetical protein AMELA_G00256960 [Ameiurus melas]|uniref:Uncharacterized protein n=1 Tax=Ameiurus melas TaxID=219545 RepID=A0A7J5ZS80_AMEME|nr:hypothetical protein AMELA_G00256960 [Ameiurus melas]